MRGWNCKGHPALNAEAQAMRGLTKEVEQRNGEHLQQMAEELLTRSLASYSLGSALLRSLTCHADVDACRGGTNELGQSGGHLCIHWNTYGSATKQSTGWKGATMPAASPGLC